MFMCFSLLLSNYEGLDFYVMQNLVRTHGAQTVQIYCLINKGSPIITNEHFKNVFIHKIYNYLYYYTYIELVIRNSIVVFLNNGGINWHGGVGDNQPRRLLRFRVLTTFI